MKKYKMLSTLIFLMSSMGTASAADLSLDSIVTAAKRNGDLSRQLLHTVFGEVVNNPFNPSGDGLLNNVFFTLNEVIAILALVYLAVIGMKKIHQAGQLGSFIEHDANGAYNIIKTTFGWLLLVPTTVGWSVAQLIFLWSGSIFGIGAANIISDKVTDELASGKALYVTPVTPEMASVAKTMFEMNLCAIGVNQGLSQMEASGQHYESDSQMQYKTGDTGYSITITNGSAQCGSVTLPAKPSGWTSIFSSSSYSDSVYSAQQRATNTLMSSMKEAATNFNEAYFQKLSSGTGELPDVETAIQNAARTYQETVQSTADDDSSQNQLKQQLSEDIKKSGWMWLGAYYHTISTANTEMNDISNLKPVVSGLSNGGELGSIDYYRSLKAAYQTNLKNSDYTPSLGSTSSSLASNIDSKQLDQAASSGDGGSFLAGVFKSPMANIVNSIATSNYGTGDGYSDVTNPLLKMKAVGDYTMDAADGAIAGWVAAKALLNVSEGNSIAGAVSSVVNFFSSSKDAVKGIMDGIAPLYYLLVFSLLGLGMSLSLWLPFVPFIFWFQALTDWLVTLMTGVVASSLWAATHINVGQSNEDKSTYGYIFLIDVMVRPLLIVMGFIFASLAIVGLGTLVNMMFKTTLLNVQADSITGIFSAIGIIGIYARICTGMVARVFGLIPRMPNYVISWIGNKVNDSVLGDMNDHVQNVIGAMSGQGKEVARNMPKSFNPGGKAARPNDKVDGFKN